MENTVKIEAREQGKNPRQLREEGFLPATIYAKGQESVSVQMNKRDFINVYKKVKDGTYELVMGNKKYNAVIQNLQIEASTQKELNVEFKAV